MCSLITSKGTDIDENIANQNHATRTRTPKPGYLNLSIEQELLATIYEHARTIPIDEHHDITHETSPTGEILCTGIISNYMASICFNESHNLIGC
jgi:hypothetical protein